MENISAVKVNKKRINPEKMWPKLVLLPSILFVSVFVYGFIAWTGYVSLSNWNSLIPDMSFAGFKNYVQLFRDFRFQSDLRNMFYFTVFFLVGVVVMGQLLAILLDRKIKGESIFRNILMFPMAISFIVTGIAWRWILNPQSGINLILEKFGWTPKWFTDTTVVPGLNIGHLEIGMPVALISLIIATVWQMTGFSLAMYLAGLRNISDEIREAARIDGASEWQMYTRIILPQLNAVTFGVIIMMLHFSLKIFDLVYTMTGPGPNFVTDMPAVYMFEAAFKGRYYATGSAIAMIMLLVVVIFIVPYMRGSKGGRT